MKKQNTRKRSDAPAPKTGCRAWFCRCGLNFQALARQALFGQQTEIAVDLHELSDSPNGKPALVVELPDGTLRHFVFEAKAGGPMVVPLADDECAVVRLYYSGTKHVRLHELLPTGNDGDGPKYRKAGKGEGKLRFIADPTAQKERILGSFTVGFKPEDDTKPCEWPEKAVQGDGGGDRKKKKKRPRRRPDSAHQGPGGNGRPADAKAETPPAAADPPAPVAAPEGDAVTVGEPAAVS